MVVARRPKTFKAFLVAQPYQPKHRKPGRGVTDVNAVLPYFKAVLGFLTPGAVILGSAVTEASDGGTRITQAEVITALVAMVVTGGAVYAAPNRDPQARHQDESVQPPNGDLRG